jgi:hypothetical protein
VFLALFQSFINHFLINFVNEDLTYELYS